HGHYIAKTGDARGALAELMGRATGCSKGCGGSMHMFNTEKGFMGSNGIVGGGIPLALGAAFTALYRGNDNVSIAFFGDGASNQGTFHESLNLAALKKLPLIAVFENNRYAATTPVADAMSSENMGGRAKGYGIPSLTIDGNDAEAVAQAAEKAVEHARKGKGPFVLDCRTYRIEPHCGIIADSRPKEELEIWRRDDKDPLNLIANNNSGILTRAKIEKIKKATALEIDDAVEFARKSPMPSVDDFIEEWGVA
ncbi:MAG: thiamine pyrophosphate-dependent dehydrogenase E1 component subunit alpha, partial [Victivallales bacterium]|nr:thiamine pyrophosphate-dependent dehydrogenase E1 component subunit alpha [Victivallales bacterium]